MKKYQQLSLFVLALISVIGLILYRKQYLELKTSVEGFSIFGEQEKPQKCVVLNETLKLDDLKLFYPVSGWMNLQDEFYVYSAFWKGKSITTAVGIGLKNRKPSFECHIWHDHGDSLFSNKGSFTFKEIQVESSDYNVFEYSCEINSPNLHGTPYMFVFIKQETKRFIPIDSGSSSLQQGSVAMCVYPDFQGLNKLNVIDFIAYHQLIGFTDFILYDEMHYGVLRKMRTILSGLNLIKSFSVLPWLVPIEQTDPAAKAVIDVDCLHRVTNKVSFIAIVSFEDYLLPKSQKKITNIIKYDSPASLKFKYQICCTDLNNDRVSEESWPLVLKKTQCMHSNESRHILINPQQDNTAKTITLKSEALINSYKRCSVSKNTKIIYDSTARKFLYDLLNSKIILLRNSGSLF
ncbi:uncharacterized protein [Rhodnius prolixus]|uniref:Glycosyltransferase family 92 protein n=2 Tax=Rhodnius TaxID=13248 RepID=R4FK84_RHOPR